MKIAAVLSRRGRQFDCVPDTASLSDAIVMMNDKGIGSVGVMTRGNSLPAGIVSQAELIEALARHGGDALSMPVLLFMKRPVPFCRCEDQVGKVLHRMTLARSRHNVVLTKNEALAGLVSLGDLVAAQLEESRMEAGVLRDLARSHLLATPPA
jgi:CBS domain-containing protein